MPTDRDTLKASLSGMDFPASKEDLVEYARNNGVDAATRRALRAVPPATYENIAEVLAAVPLDGETEEGQTDSDKAKQDQQSKSGLAEHQRRTAQNPIAEELGENRGS